MKCQLRTKNGKVQLLNIKIIIVLHIDSVDLLLHYLNEDDCIEEATDNNEMEDASTVDNENEILGKSY